MSIKAYGLKDKALTSKVQIGFTADGADFSCMRGHTSIRYYILDIDAKYPGTNEPIFDDSKTLQGLQKFRNYHSRDVCDVLCMDQVKELKEHYHMRTKHIFDFMKKMQRRRNQHW